MPVHILILNHNKWIHKSNHLTSNTSFKLSPPSINKEQPHSKFEMQTPTSQYVRVNLDLFKRCWTSTAI